MIDTTIPLALIDILADGRFYSNEQLSKRLNISVVETNKYIQILRDWIGDMLITSERGYSILEPIQLLDKDIIHNQVIDNKVIILSVVDSTNQYLLDHIDELNSGDSCVAEYQQAGRGRRGHKWFSPFAANVCLSMFWSLEQGHTAAIGISLVIAVAIAEVLHKFNINNVCVKWPNDLYLNNQKLAGILVELTGKKGGAAQIVIGVGINIIMRNVHTEVINQSWISLQKVGISLNRNVLIVCLINELRSSLKLFEQKGLVPFLSRWKRLDNFINRPVKLIIGNKKIYGISRGINSQGALMIEQNKIIKSWIGEEITLRSIYL